MDISTNIHFMGVERLFKNSRNHVLRMYVTFQLHIFILNVDYARSHISEYSMKVILLWKHWGWAS